MMPVGYNQQMLMAGQQQPTSRGNGHAFQSMQNGAQHAQMPGVGWQQPGNPAQGQGQAAVENSGGEGASKQGGAPTSAAFSMQGTLQGGLCVSFDMGLVAA